MYTDSSHGACFSMIFHRPMIIIHANNTGLDKISRLTTLFLHAGLDNISFPNTLNEFQNINWNLVDENLALQREYSKQYLITNLL